MDRLTSLTVFGQVVQSGGFSAAARRLGLSVTHVSSHIQNLEERVGARLLNRTTRRVSLTEIGRAYYEQIARILTELDEADRMASALHATPRGVLRIHTHSALVNFISPVVTSFLDEFGQAGIDLAASERAVDLVYEGYDLSIRMTLPSDTNLILRRLMSWQYVLCCSPAYLLDHPAPAVPADLGQHNCLRYAAAPHGFDWPFVGADGKQVHVRVDGNLVTNSVEMLLTRLLEGKGVLLAPTFVVAKELEAKSLIRLLPGFTPTTSVINAVYPSRHQLSAKVRIFLDRLVSHWKQSRELIEGS